MDGESLLLLQLQHNKRWGGGGKGDMEWGTLDTHHYVRVNSLVSVLAVILVFRSFVSHSHSSSESGG